MDEDQKTPVAPVIYKWVRSKENIPEIYGNMVNPSWTLVDVRFRIGQLVPIDSETATEFVSEEQAAVTISWPYVKVLRNVLSELVANYEKVNGEIKQINLPPASIPLPKE